MKKLNMKPVCQSFQIPGGGTVRFNPADPALFIRLEQLEQQVAALPKTDPLSFDRQLKLLLGETLGCGEELLKALGGVSLFAVNADGSTVLDSLLSALAPILREGAEQCAETC